MSLSRVMKFVTGGMEGFLGIPVIGGMFVISTGYTALWVMLALHAVTLLICHKEHASRLGSVIGIVTSCLAWIPIVGMLLHLLSAVVLLFSALMERDSYTRSSHRRLR